MSAKTLKTFQERAIDSALALFTGAKAQLDAAPNDPLSRENAINHNGYLLIEAPTGSGKTLIAGHIVERFSNVEDLVWFWFAPFKGVVGQSVGFLREQFQGVRLRELQDDRTTAGTRRGDVFVTTWQSVATRVKDKRNVRKDGELNPSIDDLIASLRKQGLRIGVVVDEAHHSFHGTTEAGRFFREVLRPEFTILITATPNDDDIRAFEKAQGIANLHRISVSRIDAVDSGLIKSGVRCAAYFVDDANKALVNLEDVALDDGIRTHREIKVELSKLGVSLIPLLLVQANSNDNIERIKKRLLKRGFTENQIAVHTADEPDAGLLALANDEAREVLIFKMAVALGFDAPRAFTLVTMRASKNADFGVQLVGRILRVHRRLQGRAQNKTLPTALRYGYVFLSDPETQTGLDEAGQRINQIETAYAKVSPTTVIVRVGSQPPTIQVPGPDGQLQLFPTGNPRPAVLDEGTEGASPDDDFLLSGDQGTPALMGAFHPQTIPDSETESGIKPKTAAKVIKGKYTYPLKPDMPRHFRTEIPGDNELLEEACAQKFSLDARDLVFAMKRKINIQRTTLDVFTREIQLEMNFAAELSADEIRRAAERALTRNLAFDAKELKKALLKKMTLILREEALADDADPNKALDFLNVTLAAHPELLHQAQKAALAETVEVEDAEELPAELDSESPLAASRKNIYGVIPPDLNEWERSFADLLDRETEGAVQWWHRNPDRKPWSVSVLLENGGGFYPDFLIAVNRRPKPCHVLLADPKYQYELSSEEPKVRSAHREYGRVLILNREQQTRWMIVEYDQVIKRARATRDFRLSDMAGF